MLCANCLQRCLPAGPDVDPTKAASAHTGAKRLPSATAKRKISFEDTTETVQAGTPSAERPHEEAGHLVRRRASGCSGILPLTPSLCEAMDTLLPEAGPFFSGAQVDAEL